MQEGVAQRRNTNPLKKDLENAVSWKNKCPFPCGAERNRCTTKSTDRAVPFIFKHTVKKTLIFPDMTSLTHLQRNKHNFCIYSALFMCRVECFKSLIEYSTSEIVGLIHSTVRDPPLTLFKLTACSQLCFILGICQASAYTEAALKTKNTCSS